MSPRTAEQSKVGLIALCCYASSNHSPSPPPFCIRPHHLRTLPLPRIRLAMAAKRMKTEESPSDKSCESRGLKRKGPERSGDWESLSPADASASGPVEALIRSCDGRPPHSKAKQLKEPAEQRKGDDLAIKEWQHKVKIVDFIEK